MDDETKATEIHEAPPVTEQAADPLPGHVDAPSPAADATHADPEAHHDDPPASPANPEAGSPEQKRNLTAEIEETLRAHSLTEFFAADRWHAMTHAATLKLGELESTLVGRLSELEHSGPVQVVVDPVHQDVYVRPISFVKV